MGKLIISNDIENLSYDLDAFSIKKTEETLNLKLIVNKGDSIEYRIHPFDQKSSLDGIEEFIVKIH